MAALEGIATMYLSMPMCAQPLPILGSSAVNDKKISLRFPLTTVSFDLPEQPREGGRDMELKMAGPRGDMSLKISWKAEMGAFVGSCSEGGSNVVTFVLYKPNSGLRFLKSL